jgi:hypothetical protein
MSIRDSGGVKYDYPRLLSRESNKGKNKAHPQMKIEKKKLYAPQRKR